MIDALDDNEDLLQRKDATGASEPKHYRRDCHVENFPFVTFGGLMQTVTPEFLLEAYANGYFPMAESADAEELHWCDPTVRGIFPLDGLIISKSLAKKTRRDCFEVTVDRDFEAVIAACAEKQPDRPNTWINTEIRNLYRALFERGAAHSVEVRQQGRLVGGLYGVKLNGAFFGESMFSREADASKVALVHLVARLRAGGFSLLDAQMPTAHLQSLGLIATPRRQYRRLLAQAMEQDAKFPNDARLELTGAQALALVRSGPLK